MRLVHAPPGHLITFNVPRKSAQWLYLQATVYNKTMPLGCTSGSVRHAAMTARLLCLAVSTAVISAVQMQRVAA